MMQRKHEENALTKMSSHSSLELSWILSKTSFTPLPPKTLDRRPCTGRSPEAVVIFLFGLEALFTRDSRVLSFMSPPPLIDCYWLLHWSNPVSIGSHSDQTSFQSSSLYLRALGKHCFVKMSSFTFCYTVFLYNVFACPHHSYPPPQQLDDTVKYTHRAYIYTE